MDDQEVGLKKHAPFLKLVLNLLPEPHGVVEIQLAASSALITHAPISAGSRHRFWRPIALEVGHRGIRFNVLLEAAARR